MTDRACSNQTAIGFFIGPRRLFATTHRLNWRKLLVNVFKLVRQDGSRAQAGPGAGLGARSAQRSPSPPSHKPLHFLTFFVIIPPDRVEREKAFRPCEESRWPVQNGGGQTCIRPGARGEEPRGLRPIQRRQAVWLRPCKLGGNAESFRPRDGRGGFFFPSTKKGEMQP